MAAPLTDHPIKLNGFEVALPAKVDVILLAMPDSRDVKAERERLADWWFVHWFGGNLYCLRLKAGGPNVEGTPAQLHVPKHPWLLRARLDDAIPALFDQYPIHRERPFVFLSLRD